MNIHKQLWHPIIVYRIKWLKCLVTTRSLGTTISAWSNLRLTIVWKNSKIKMTSLNYTTTSRLLSTQTRRKAIACMSFKWQSTRSARRFCRRRGSTRTLNAKWPSPESKHKNARKSCKSKRNNSTMCMRRCLLAQNAYTLTRLGICLPWADWTSRLPVTSEPATGEAQSVEEIRWAASTSPPL